LTHVNKNEWLAKYAPAQQNGYPDVSQQHVEIEMES
jgi:hypothetical protein